MQILKLVVEGGQRPSASHATFQVDIGHWHAGQNTGNQPPQKIFGHI
jgi:hypothetical protein